MDMLKLLKWRHKIANMIIKDHVIRYVEAKPSDPFSIHKWGERELPSGLIQDGKIQDEETLEMILEECVQEWKLKNRRIRFVVPDAVAVIRRIFLPHDLQEDEIRGYLFMELGTTIHLPFEDPVFDFTILEHTDEKWTILLFAAPEELVAHYARLLEKVKLQPIAADVSPLCVYRLFYAADQVEENDHLLIVQMDETAVNVSAFHRHIPIFMRQLLFEPLEEAASASPVHIEEMFQPFEDVYKEIERVMSFYHFSIQQGKEQINRLLLTGDHRYLPQIYQSMQERFDVPVEQLSPSLAAAVDSRYHLAWGLGLKEGTNYAHRR
ncbi:type IV pilus assembly [Anoxybacillus sp. B7M1]|uniref:type IV pilus biogenesis protein PilM n=1 Tax=unclassified Anoxybacillus TaxID=2639704 RepID=UPI0005CDC6CF|nr:MULTISPECIES: pilus assembly protein PilM [unclassified Anoxybacillus]ANB57420.1 type IV pilus assembly PilM family protein [Anoxybacillus sp. B2M1]ANB65210.1 type IV pilus assembly [Anoxybacillus sp. B7M1]